MEMNDVDDDRTKHCVNEKGVDEQCVISAIKMI